MAGDRISVGMTCSAFTQLLHYYTNDSGDMLLLAGYGLYTMTSV